MTAFEWYVTACLCATAGVFLLGAVRLLNVYPPSLGIVTWRERRRSDTSTNKDGWGGIR